MTTTLREIKTHGYARKRNLPAIPGNPKTCIKCHQWFVAQPYERVCHGCVKPSVRALRGAKAGGDSRSPYTRKLRSRGMRRQWWPGCIVPATKKWPVPFYVRWDLIQTAIGKSWRFHSATDQNGRPLEFVEVVAWLRG